MSLSTCYLEYGRHVARLHRRRRRRAYAPTSNTASHDNHEKINSWVSFCFPYMGCLWGSAIIAAGLFFILEVQFCNLRPSKANFVLCDVTRSCKSAFYSVSTRKFSFTKQTLLHVLLAYVLKAERSDLCSEL